MALLSSRSRWALVAALPFLSLGVGLLLLLVDVVLALVVAALGAFVLTPVLAVVFAFWPASDADESGAAESAPATATRDQGTATRNPATTAGDDDLQALRSRYTSGEIDEAEFERLLEDHLADGPPEGAAGSDAAGPAAPDEGDSSAMERDPE